MYKNRNLEEIKKEEIIDINKEGNNLYIKDGISIKKITLSEYVDLIKASIKELVNLIDKSEIESVHKCHKILSTQVMEKLSDIGTTNLSLKEIEEALSSDLNPPPLAEGL